MQSQLAHILQEAVSEGRTGVLSGKVKPLEDSPSDVLFSFLFHSGILQLCQCATLEKEQALFTVTNAVQIVRLSWMNLSQDNTNSSDQVQLHAILLSLLQVERSAEVEALQAITPLHDVAAEMEAEQINLISTQAMTVFSDFFGNQAKDMLKTAYKKSGTPIVKHRLIQACVDQLSPMMGEPMARSYFEKF